MKGSFGKRHNKNFWMSFLIFVCPILIIYSFCFTVPFGGAIYYSFTSWNGLAGTEVFTGIENYIRVFTDSDFFASIGRTATFVFWNCLATNILAMTFAVLLSEGNRFNNTSRMLIFMPNVISLIVTGFIWQFLLSRVVRQIYDQTGFFLFGFDFLGDPNIVIISCALVSLWAGVGYIMVIYIAALQGIDASHIEAATIDGCTKWQTFWKIKMPEMLPTVSIGIFLNIAGSIKIFDLIWSLTKGGPGGASEVVMINIYREAFERQLAGYANAKSLVLTIIIVAVTAIQLKLTKGEVD